MPTVAHPLSRPPARGDERGSPRTCTRGAERTSGGGAGSAWYLAPEVALEFHHQLARAVPLTPCPVSSVGDLDPHRGLAQVRIARLFQRQDGLIADAAPSWQIR